MAELPDPRWERFAKLLSIGVDAHKAYGEAGFRPDRSNASKASRQPEVLERVSALQAAEAARLEAAADDDSGMTGERLLRIAAAKAQATGNLVALVQAGKALGESDGSLKPTVPEQMTDLDLSKRLEAQTGLSQHLFRFLMGRASFGDTDYDVALAWITARLNGIDPRSVFRP